MNFNFANHSTNSSTSRTRNAGRVLALTAVVTLGLLFTASAAQASGCGSAPKPGAAAAPAVFVNPHAGDRDDRDDDRPAKIVGLWHLIYTAEQAEGLPSPPFPSTTPFQFLESFKTWHADGTEFENAFLPPAGGNVCVGVWKDLGHNTVKLHHIGLMFAPDGSISNIFTVDEIDTVDRGGEVYTGTFQFKLWPNTFASVGVGKPLALVTGKTVGTRINVE